MHLLHESCAIRPEEAFSKRAQINYHLLEEYSKLIANIEESGLPWNAEQRRHSIEKLLNLDVCYLESHLKPGKLAEKDMSRIRASLIRKPQDELQDELQDESREFW